METLKELFEDQIKDLFSAENQLIKALPRMAKRASSPELKSGIEQHLRQTQEQANRLEQIASELDFRPSGKKCMGMEGLIKEGKEALEEDGNDAVIDAAIISAAQKVEHYEISGYGTAIALAEQLGLTDAVELLRETLEEEKETDEKLTELCASEIFPAAPKDDEEGEEEEEEEGASKSGRGGSASYR